MLKILSLAGLKPQAPVWSWAYKAIALSTQPDMNPHNQILILVNVILKVYLIRVHVSINNLTMAILPCVQWYSICIFICIADWLI